MSFFFYCFYVFLTFILARGDLYCQSNCSFCSDGSKPSSPEQNINTAIYNLLSSNGGFLYLLPSDQDYFLYGYRFIDKPLIIKSYEQGGVIPNLVVSGDFNVQVQNSLILENVKLTRRTTNTIGALLNMNGNSFLEFNSVEIYSFSNDGQFERFIKGGPCKITLNNCSFINNNFEIITSFIEIWSSSVLIIQNSNFNNIELYNSVFFKIWDPLTCFYVENSFFMNMDLNKYNNEGYDGSLIVSNGRLSFSNVTFYNISLHQGALIRVLENSNLETNTIDFLKCSFTSINTLSRGLFLNLIGVEVEIYIKDILFFNTTNYFSHGSLVYILNGDNTTLSLSNIVSKNNYGLILDCLYAKLLYFNNIYIYSHNMRPTSEKPVDPFYVSYIESVAYMSFNRFFIDGAYSDRDVGGLKIHINYEIYYRYNDVKARINAGDIIYMNFTNCYFGNITSSNLNWMDTGSGMAFHSNIPLKVLFINTSFIDNINDKGATCMEVYGQNILDLYFEKSIFMGNQAPKGSTCLSIFILAVKFNESIFINNHLITKTDKISAFSEGVEGGAIYSETNMTDFHSCFFKMNAAYQGGALFFYDINIPQINISIFNSTFTGNQAKIGGAISIASIIYSLIFSIKNSTFIDNQALNGACLYLDFSSNISTIDIVSSFFLENKGLKGGVAFISTEGFNIYFENNKFISNLAWNFTYLNVLSSGGVYYVSEEADSTLINFNNHYENNTSYNSAGVLSINRGVSQENQSNFLMNTAYNQGGTAIIRNSASFNINSCKFSGEKSGIWGGSWSISENSKFFIINSFFSNCQASQGGAFFIENHLSVEIMETVFESNTANEGGIMLIYTAINDLSIKNCTFLNHGSQKTLISINSLSGIFKMSFIVSKNNKCNIISISNSNAYIDNCEIFENDCSDSSISGCILDLEEASVTLNKLFIYNATIKNEGSIFYSLYSKSTLEIKSISFINVKGISMGSCITSLHSTISIYDSIFIKTGYSCTHFSYSFINITKSSFDNFENNVEYNALIDYSNYGSFIFSENSYNISITLSNFSNNYQKISMLGSAIKGYSSLKNSYMRIDDCNFNNNSVVYSGGAIYFKNQEFTIENSNFINNSATSGGAIYFERQISNISSLKIIKGNNFLKNKASMKGGAIYFYDDYMNFSENTFLYNNATYGPEVASLPVFFKIKVYKNRDDNLSSIANNEKILNESFLIFDSSKQSLDEFVIEDISPGQKGNLTFSCELIDYFNQTIITENVGLGHLQVIFPLLNYSAELNRKAKISNEINKKYDFENSSFSISGNIDSYNRKGTFFFDSLTIYGTPTSYLNIFIKNDLLTQFYPQNTKNFQIVNKTIGLLLIMHFRGCISGEIYDKKINYCSQCPIGKYSLDVKDSSCLDCPSHSICLGGSKISIEKQYWRAPKNDTLDIYFCYIYPDACLGGIDYESSCLDGYSGPLCSTCQLGSSYTKIGKYCVRCLNDLLNTICILILLVSFGGFVIMMIRSHMAVKPETFITNKADSLKTPNASLVYKLLIDHIQLLGINENVGFNVPDYFRAFNDVQTGGVYFAEQLLSFDCFIKATNKTFNLTSSIVFVRSLLVASMPIFAVIMIFLFWTFYFFIKKESIIKLKSKIFSSIVINLFLLQPTILNSMSRLLSCVRLGKDEYVIADMNMTCWSSEHITMVVFFAIPSLLIWNILFPLFCLYKISKSKKNLKDEITVLNYGFLYNGFDEKSYYWGFAKYFQKSLIILLRMSNIDVGAKMLTTLLIWIFTLSWKRFNSNYVHKFMNDLEYRSNFINMISLFLGIYIIMGVSEIAQSLIFVLIVVINAYFIGYWIKCFFFSQKTILHNAFAKITQRLFKHSSMNSSVASNSSSSQRLNHTKSPPKPSKFAQIKPIVRLPSL